jgi:succinoglycan biosynthesis transport protein ExoP
MDRIPPPVESLPRFAPHFDEGAITPWHRSIRARLFAVTFGLTLALGVGWTLLQPVVYRSSATVLMSAPTAVDATVEIANVQSVAIQRRILLGGEVTQSLLSTLEGEGIDDADMHYLRRVLRVDATPDTNLVEMIAEGEDAELLPTLVNRWIDVYLAIRAANVQQSQDQTLQVVEDQLSGLGSRLDAAREALATYRNDNDITSVEKQQNEELARLEGLNSAVNNAVKAEVEAGAKLESLRSAIAAGRNVVPQSERKGVETMEEELADLQRKLSTLSKTYTMNYISNQPGTRDIPVRIAELEAALNAELAKSTDVVLAQAEQEHAAAQQTVDSLQQKLDVQKQEAARFTTIYTKHQALAKDLEDLEALNRETQSRLVQVQVNQVEKYPQVSVIDRPSAESERVGPNYLILLGASLGSALGLGVLSVWLYGYLGPRPPKPAYVTLSGVHMYPQEVSGQLAYAPQADHRLGRSDTRLLQRDETVGPTTGPQDKSDE